MRRQTDGRMDGRMDRPYFIGPFWLRPGVQRIPNHYKCTTTPEFNKLIK